MYMSKLSTIWWNILSKKYILKYFFMLNSIEYFHNVILIVTLELLHIWECPPAPYITYCDIRRSCEKGVRNKIGYLTMDGQEFMSVASRMSIHSWVTTDSANKFWLTPWVCVLELHSKFKNASKKNWNQNNKHVLFIWSWFALNIIFLWWWLSSQVTLATRTRANIFACLKYISWSRKLPSLWNNIGNTQGVVKDRNY